MNVEHSLQLEMIASMNFTVIFEHDWASHEVYYANGENLELVNLFMHEFFEALEWLGSTSCVYGPRLPYARKEGKLLEHSRHGMELKVSGRCNRSMLKSIRWLKTVASKVTQYFTNSPSFDVGVECLTHEVWSWLLNLFEGKLSDFHEFRCYWRIAKYLATSIHMDKWCSKRLNCYHLQPHPCNGHRWMNLPW